ncbi:MAG: hypothetical protein WCO66_02250 [Candidatus Absconditabacteria bacterium]
MPDKLGEKKLDKTAPKTPEKKPSNSVEKWTSQPDAGAYMKKLWNNPEIKVNPSFAVDPMGIIKFPKRKEALKTKKGLEAKPVNNKEVNKKAPTTRSKELSDLRSEIGDTELMRLRNLVRDGNRSDIESITKTDWFKEQMKIAQRDPKHNAFIIQVYGKFVLGDNSIVVDGKYGEQTRGILIQYAAAEVSQKTIEERRNRIERRNRDTEALTKEAQNTKTISEKIIIDKENDVRYAKIFDLGDTVIESLTRPNETIKKTPEQVAEIHRGKQEKLFAMAKSSAKNGCINYLQQLFNQTINVPGNPEHLENMFQNLDLTNGIAPHEQNIDFKVMLDGKPFSICYNIYDGELKYTPLFMVNNGGDIIKGSASQEKTLFTKGQMPSLGSMLIEAKSGVKAAAQDKPFNRRGVIGAIKNIEIPKADIAKNKEMIAKTVAQESCMQTFLSLTGYDPRQNLSKEIYGNTQLFLLYDIFNHTLNNPKTTPEDIIRLKGLLEKTKNMVMDYQDPTKIAKRNIRSEQFAEKSITKGKSSMLSPKANSNINSSLPFYTFFVQYVDLGIADTKAANYRVLDIHKIDTDLALYSKNNYLDDLNIRKILANNEQKNADFDLTQSLKFA